MRYIVNIDRVINYSQKILKDANIQNSNKEAKLIIGHVAKLNQVEILNSKKTLNNNQLKSILSKINRRANGEPYAYITGQKHFYNINLFVNKNVLIPRPETEHVIESILSKIENINDKYNIIDIGTGSGAILCTLLTQLPNSYGLGTDISKKAIKVAYKNIKKLRIQNRCNLITTKWAEAVNTNFFDILTCNPPYIDEKELLTLSNEIIDHEPKIALDGGKKGIEAFDKMLPSARACLKLKGKAFFEIGYNQTDKALLLLRNNNFKICKIYKDLAGINRVIFATAI